MILFFHVRVFVKAELQDRSASMTGLRNTSLQQVNFVFETLLGLYLHLSRTCHKSQTQDELPGPKFPLAPCRFLKIYFHGQLEAPSSTIVSVSSRDNPSGQRCSSLTSNQISCLKSFSLGSALHWNSFDSGHPTCWWQQKSAHPLLLSFLMYLQHSSPLITTFS